MEDTYHLTPIMNAIKFKHWTIVKYLLESTDATIIGALPRDEDIEYEWLVRIKTITNRYLAAAKTNNWGIMSECLEGPDRDIIKKGIDFEERTTASQIAAQYGHLDIVRNIVVRNLLGPSYYDDLYRIATEAATYGHLPVVEYIFSRPDFEYETFEFSGFRRIDFEARKSIAIFGAVTNGHINVVAFLCSHTPSEVLEFVAIDCQKPSVLHYLHANQYIDVQSDDFSLHDGRTYLVRAAQKGNLDVVKWLIKTMNVDARVSDANGVTPLMAAFDEDALHDYSYARDKPKSLDTAYWLMENSGVGIDDIVDKDTGRSALMVACQMNLLEVVENILKHTNVDLDAVNDAGESVWDMADWRGNHYNSYVNNHYEKVLKMMFIKCKDIPDSFKDKYPDDPSFQSLIERGQILRDRIKLYEKARKKALKQELSTSTTMRPEGLPKDAIRNILSFGELTLSEKWYMNKRRL
jgi:ankyrin repeat protein